jgi:hypothetical protein
MQSAECIVQTALVRGRLRGYKYLGRTDRQSVVTILYGTGIMEVTVRVVSD